MMKGTDHFKEIIKNYLDGRAQSDELFRAKYETTTRTIDDVVTYILNEVKASGCCGFSDDEIFSMAVHVIDEPTIESKRVKMGVAGVEAAERRFPEGVVLKFLSEFNNF